MVFCDKKVYECKRYVFVKLFGGLTPEESLSDG
jgi:hypothetical protein